AGRMWPVTGAKRKEDYRRPHQRFFWGGACEHPVARLCPGSILRSRQLVKWDPVARMPQRNSGRLSRRRFAACGRSARERYPLIGGLLNKENQGRVDSQLSKADYSQRSALSLKAAIEAH